MSELRAVGADFSLVEVACPICGKDGGTPLVPSAKRDEVGNTFFVDERIMISLCENCGTVFENPQIRLEGSTPYAERNYYTEANTAWGHDNIQHNWTFYNWQALKDAMPWDQFTHVMDVGAAGAWSNAMRERAPNIIEAVLVEPSPKGIFNCEVRYPKVRAELGIFEEYEDTEGTFDLITFFNSFYSISDPRSALAKVNALLKPGGYLVLCFSYVGMNLEFWDHGNPFVHMSHVVRGVPLIYYSENTYRKLLDISGFEVVDDIVFDIPEGDPFEQSERQLNFVIAKSVRSPVPKVDLRLLEDPEEVERGRRFYTQYCKLTTEKSIRLYLERYGAGDWVVVHDGDALYGRWVLERISELGGHAILVDGKSVPVGMLADRIDDTDGRTVFLAGDWTDAADEASSKFKRAKVVNCSPPDGYKGYGNWVANPQGEIVITRSFCPCGSLGDHIFPFEKRAPINDFREGAAASGVVERERFSLPASVDDIPFFASEVSRLALAMSREKRSELLKPHYDLAMSGIHEESIISIAGVRLPADPEIPDLETILSAKRISGIRPMIQWAALCGPMSALQASIQRYTELYAEFMNQG